MAIYLLAVALPLAVILLTVRLSAPAFVFEHLMVLLVVAVALFGGHGPAMVVALTGSVGDNILLREPFGRPAISGTRDLLDLALFMAVAMTVGWLVHRLTTALQRAEQAAERERAAREERDRLVAMVTHDLATPLSAIQGTIQFARKNAALSSLDFPRLLVRVETAAARATSLVRTLSDVRSIGLADLSLTLCTVDLRTVVEPTVRMLDRVSERHPIVLAMPPAPVVIAGDVERLGRVVDNLITNAIKYSPDGGTVEVQVAATQDTAEITVSDHGIGIPENGGQRMFELGFRGDAAAAVAPGLGLGLYMAAEVVRRHHGSIEATRREPKGTTVTIRLPLIRGAPSLHRTHA